MKATLSDGKILTGNMVALCTGYVAESIELEAQDVDDMISMLENNPDRLHVALRQLSARYKVNRVGGKNVNNLNRRIEANLEKETKS